ncbi:MAG: T9SS type A sorting domain-containing protein [Saprospiraceae bacterium]|nr:T9SS type A sorting domain-containing protein [Saprospiraceae bacterium]
MCQFLLFTKSAFSLIDSKGKMTFLSSVWTKRQTFKHLFLIGFMLLFLQQNQVIAQTPELLYYRFNGSGTSVPNEASTPPAGTETATITGDQTQGSKGQCGGALIGTGSNSTSNFVNSNWIPDLGGSSWTLSLWINNGPNTNSSTLWYIFGDVNTNGFRCFTNGVAGADNFWLRGGGLTDVAVNGGAAAGPQTITFVYDNTLNNVKAYLNGVLVNTVAQGAVNITGTGPFKVAGYSTNSGLASGSLMDEFRLYNRALSATEVAAIAGNICLCYIDADGDGYGDAEDSGIMPEESGCPTGMVGNNEDCNDDNENINPEGTEICDNIDNDCSGIADDGEDLDGDGYSTAQGDCDDCNDNVNPGQTELCGNDIDDNCNGQIDETLSIDPVDCSIFYGFSPFQDSVWTIDTSINYAIIERRSPVLPGFTVTGVNGAAKNPVTDIIYAIVKVSGVNGRVLCTFNPTDATMTQIGNLGDNFSSITFSPSGQLFGVTGDGATVKETLYDINPADGSKTLLTALGNGADGEVICYNPDDNMIYHWSGNGTIVYEKILPAAPYTVTNIPIIGATNGETFGAAYIGNNKFLISNISSSFNIISTGGNWGPVFGSNPDDLRGLPFNTCSVTCYADVDGDGYGNTNAPQVFQGVCGVGYVRNSEDCNDSNDNVYPCAEELCDGIDNDCDGFIDELFLLPCGWSSEANGVNCNQGSNVAYSPGNQLFTVTSTNCYYPNSFNSDALAFAQYDLCGNGGITAQVTSITPLGLGWAGVTMRESNASGAKKAQLMTNLGAFSRREFRTVTGAAAYPQQFPSQNRYWLRITRTGNQFAMYISQNGTSWSLNGSQTIVMGNCIEVGLVVTNYNPNSTVTANFANVSVTGGNITKPAINTQEDLLTAADFTIMPNPTTGIISLDLNSYGKRQVRLDMYNLQGKLLRSTNMETGRGKEEIDLTAFANGMYLISIKAEGLPDVTKRVVLNSNY